MVNSYNGFIIIASLIAALILTLLPMPDWTIWLRPVWVLLVLTYWMTVIPHRVNLGFAWCSGLCLDILHGTLLGEHALALTIVSYFIVRIHSRFRMFPIIQQALFVFVFVLFYQFIIFCIQGFMGDVPKRWLYWFPAFTSMLVWPWVSVILYDCRKRFKVS